MKCDVDMPGGMAIVNAVFLVPDENVYALVQVPGSLPASA